MKVCIIRNAEANSNASMMRVLDALIYGGYEVTLLSRNREATKTKEKIIRREINYKDNIIDNYEIQLPSNRGDGISNITNLLNYMYISFMWLKKNRNNFDVIHSFDLDTGFPAGIASRIYKKKLVYHIADFYVDSRGGIPNKLKNKVKKIEFSVINNANLTIVCTDERIKQINGSKPQKIAVIHNTPVTEEKEKITDNKSIKTISENPIIISYVGGLTETRFIKEILEVVSKDPRLYLEIAGYGPLSVLVKNYDEKYKNIKYHGSVNYFEGLKINANSDLMIAMYDPTLKNNQYSAPNKIYEAMYFSKPIIVAAGTGVDKLVSNEKIGFVSEYEINSFKEKIDFIMNNPNLFKKYNQNAKEAYSKYSWNKMRTRLISEYEKL